MDVFELNKKYEENSFQGIYQGIKNFKVIYGNIPILLSAPHAVKHVRNGLFKDSDGLTGGIVEYLSMNKSTFGITRVHNMLDDPNYYNYGESLLYKNAIISLIENYQLKYLLDIHGCSDEHYFDIDIGTNDRKNIGMNEDILSMMINYLSKLGKVCVDSKFKASRFENISRYINENTNISCFQIELSTNIRVNKTKELVKTMGKIIDEISYKR